MTQGISLRTYQGAVVVITGGASGIGRALGEAMARQGAKVVLVDRQIELAETVAGGIRDRGGQASAVEVDVTDYPALEHVIRGTAEKHARLDYMFNNAGIGISGEACYYDIKDWEQVIDVNIRGVINGIQAAYPIMIRQGFGHIINTASMAGLVPSPVVVSYCASKFAVVGVSLSLRIEAAEKGVRVSVLCPGVVRTPILEGGKYGKSLQALPPEAWKKLWEKQRPMDVEKFADLALHAVAKNRAIIIFPRYWRIFWWLSRLSPSLSLYIGKKGFGVWRRTCEEYLPSSANVS